MKLKVSRADVWVASLKDKPGALAQKLAPLAQAGANLEFIIARRCPDEPGTGVVFITPLQGLRQLKAAKLAGFTKTKSLYALRVVAPDAKGLGAKITAALAAAGVNLRGLSAAALAKQSVTHLAFNSAAQAQKALRILKKLS